MKKIHSKKMIAGALSAVLLVGGIGVVKAIAQNKAQDAQTIAQAPVEEPKEVPTEATKEVKDEAQTPVEVAEVPKETPKEAAVKQAQAEAPTEAPEVRYDPKPTQEQYANNPVQSKEVLFKHALKLWLLRNPDERSNLTEAEVAILENKDLDFKDTATYTVTSDPMPVPPGYNSVVYGDETDV